MNTELSAKTFTISIIFILFASLAFLGGLYYYLNDWKFPWTTQNKILNYIPVTKEPVSFNLEIANPENNTATTEKTIVISGTSSPGAIVMISNDTDNTGFEVNHTGNFSQIVALKSGINQIIITAFDDQGDKKIDTRTIYMTEEKTQ